MIIPAGIDKPADIVARYTAVDTKSLTLCETWEDAIKFGEDDGNGHIEDIPGGCGMFVHGPTGKLVAILGKEALAYLEEAEEHAKVIKAKRDAEWTAGTAPVDIDELAPKTKAFKDELKSRAEARAAK